MKVATMALMSVVLVLASFSAMSKPTSPVYVANFPLDEQGNLKVKIVDGKPLPDHLDLYAVASSLANSTDALKFSLVDSIRVPDIDYFTYIVSSGDYIEVFNETFIQEVYTQRSYKIQGEVFITVKFVISFPLGDGSGWFRGVTNLEKILENGTRVNVASWNIAERGNIEDPRHLDYEGVLTKLFKEPVNVLEGERLALGLSIEVKSNPAMHFNIYLGSYLKVRIPITQK